MYMVTIAAAPSTSIMELMSNLGIPVDQRMQSVYDFLTNSTSRIQLGAGTLTPIQLSNLFMTALDEAVDEFTDKIHDKLLINEPKLAGIDLKDKDAVMAVINSATDITVTYIDTVTKRLLPRTVQTTYQLFREKLDAFKIAIKKIFVNNPDINISQSEFRKEFMKNIITPSSMGLPNDRKFYETEGISQQCDIVDTIPDIPPSIIPAVEIPDKRFEDGWEDYCYICDSPISPGESSCEHILPVFQAVGFGCLIQANTDLSTIDPITLALMKLEYAGSHNCCNMHKNNHSFITIAPIEIQPADPTTGAPQHITTPPVIANESGIKTILNKIVSSHNLGESGYGCNSLKHLKNLNVDDQTNIIIENFINPLIYAINKKLQLADGTYPIKDVIVFFIRLCQLISYQPSLEHTISCILTRDVSVMAKNIGYISYNKTYVINELMKLLAAVVDVDTNNDIYIIHVGFTTDSEISSLIIPAFKTFMSGSGMQLPKGFDTLNLKQCLYFAKTPLSKSAMTKSKTRLFALKYVSDEFTSNVNAETTYTQNDWLYNESFPVASTSKGVKIVGEDQFINYKLKLQYNSLIDNLYQDDCLISEFEQSYLSELFKISIGLEFACSITGFICAMIDVAQYNNLMPRLNTIQNNYFEHYKKFLIVFFICQTHKLIYILGSEDLDILKNIPPDQDTNDTYKNIVIENKCSAKYYLIIDALKRINNQKIKDILNKFITEIISGLSTPLNTTTIDKYIVDLKPMFDYLYKLRVDTKAPIIVDLFEKINYKLNKEIRVDKDKKSWYSSIVDLPLTPLPAAPSGMSGGSDQMALEQHISSVLPQYLNTTINALVGHFEPLTIKYKLRKRYLSGHYDTSTAHKHIKYTNPNSTEFIINVYDKIKNDITGTLTKYPCILINNLENTIRFIGMNSDVVNNIEPVYTTDKVLTQIEKEGLQYALSNISYLNNSSFFNTNETTELLYWLFVKFNLFMYFDSARNQVTDVNGNILYTVIGTYRGAGYKKNKKQKNFKTQNNKIKKLKTKKNTNFKTQKVEKMKEKMKKSKKTLKVKY